MHYCQVAVNSPFNNSILTYHHDSEKEIRRGDLFYVPLGSRYVKGCILETGLKHSEYEGEKIKPVGPEYGTNFHLDDKVLEVFEWVCRYYHYPLGQHIFNCLPKPLKRPRKLNVYEGRGVPLDFKINSKQKEYYEKIIQSQGFQKWLLHGITGSGKTIVYLLVMNHIIQGGRSVLFLLPEINLTPQTLKFFQHHCHGSLYVYNSALSNSDKYGLWKKLSEDSGPKVILGARSSVFLPIKNLGLIVVDEEHDASFKQENRCPYHARDIAIKRASLEKIPIILGSATPSLEIYNQFKGGENYLVMKNRPNKYKLPDVKLIDVRNMNKERFYPFAKESIEGIKKALDKKEQILVFVNRLGFAQFIQCSSCGHQFYCPNCSVNLKYYKKRNQLFCQHCEYKEHFPEKCPECSNLNLLQCGYGTEKLAEVLMNIFPDKKIKRFDRDDIGTFGKLNQRLEEFHRGEIDVLVGTQMLSKGHNFEKVNLVVILGIDSQLNFPDFRATERVFQTMTQVSGRSGRFGEQGRVMVQTLNPENDIFSCMDDPGPFYERELEIRKICRCPPFSRQAELYFTAKDSESALELAGGIANILKRLGKDHFSSINVSEPRPALVEKKVNKYTWCLLVQSCSPNELHNSLKTLRFNLKLPRNVSLKIDVDPVCIG